MIVDVGLSPTSLIDISSNVIGPAGRTLNSAFADAMRSHGALVIISKEDRQAILHLVRTAGSLSPSEQREWQGVLEWLTQNRRIRIVNPVLSGSIDASRTGMELERAHDRQPLLAVLGKATFDRLFPDSIDGQAKVSDSTEVARADTAPVASHFDQARLTAAREVFPAGTLRELIWDDVLRPLAAGSKQITIFDRYAFASLHRRDKEGRDAPEHLVWLLRRLDQVTAYGAHVKIYGSIGYELSRRHGLMVADPNVTAELLDARWAKQDGNIASVELVTVSSLREQHHDRHITFGPGMGLDLPSGMDRLQNRVLAEPFSFSYKWRNEQLQALRDRESTTQHARPQITPVAMNR